MNLILLGPPGAGKGTQAKMIASCYSIPHISTGDMFRETAQTNSDLGRELKSLLASGQLVPDSIVIEIVKNRLLRPDCVKGFLLDGFPRTLTQAETLDEILVEQNKKIDAVVYITVPDEDIIRRLASRRVCSKCGASYNLISQPTKLADVCDFCKGAVIQRNDDNADIICKRLKVYNDQTSPLIEYYSSKEVLCKVDGTQSVEAVFNQITDRINKKRNQEYCVRKNTN